MLKCPICASHNLYKFLIKKQVPVHQNLLVSNPKSAINTIRGDLNTVVCEECGFVFNQTFDSSKLSYGKDYDNAQNYSTYFTKHITNLVNDLILKKNVKNSNILEIGCGNGYFLNQLVKNKEWGNFGFGFDPSYKGSTLDKEKHLKFKISYFDPDRVDIPVDVVICRHVIEHIPDPLNLLRNVRKVLNQYPDAHVFFETPTVEWILENKIIWDFTYEHCSFFTKNSLTTAFQYSGFQVKDVSTLFEGQYLWMEAVPYEKYEMTKTPGQISRLVKAFEISEKKITKEWKIKIKMLANKGKVALWGAGGKGTTFVNLFDKEHRLIDCLIDLNPKKWNKYVAGSGHPIVNYTEIRKRKIKTVVVMNPNYYNEISKLLMDKNISVDLLK